MSDDDQQETQQAADTRVQDKSHNRGNRDNKDNEEDETDKHNKNQSKGKGDTEKHNKDQSKKDQHKKHNKEDEVGNWDGRSRQREFFKSELRRLETSLKRESSKIHAPPRREFAPFVFNSLEPYYNTHTTKYLIELPADSQQSQSFTTRSTAQGLTDPWVDLRMDHDFLPQISPGPNNQPKTNCMRGSNRKSKKATSSEPIRKEGSTRLPKFPVVSLETKELATKELYYSDVPMLRRELKNKYSSQAKSKIEADYKRTQQDFYRMDLDRLDQVAPGSRRHLTDTYLAYLQNTPGSRRAITECVRTLQGTAR